MRREHSPIDSSSAGGRMGGLPRPPGCWPFACEPFASRIQALCQGAHPWRVHSLPGAALLAFGPLRFRGSHWHLGGAAQQQAQCLHFVGSASRQHCIDLCPGGLVEIFLRCLTLGTLAVPPGTEPSAFPSVSTAMSVGSDAGLLGCVSGALTLGNLAAAPGIEPRAFISSTLASASMNRMSAPASERPIGHIPDCML